MLGELIPWFHPECDLGRLTHAGHVLAKVTVGREKGRRWNAVSLAEVG